MDAIVVEDLHKRYGDVQALNGVSFTVAEGEVFGLLGPNGAGKTTTVKILSTLTKPDSGRAEVVMCDVVRDPNAVRRTIGYVPQNSGVDREATGRENLMLQGRVQGMSGQELRNRVNELLELVGITDAADRVVRGRFGETLHQRTAQVRQHARRPRTLLGQARVRIGHGFVRGVRPLLRGAAVSGRGGHAAGAGLVVRTPAPAPAGADGVTMRAKD